MSIFSSRLSLVLVLAALCLGARTGHAQVAPVSYWIPGWPLGFGGDPTAGPGLNAYGNFPGFNFSDARGGGFSYARYNFSNGWFVGSQSGSVALGLSGINQVGAFGNMGSLDYQGVQFGYNFQAGGVPATAFAGFSTLNYNANSSTSGLLAFDNISSTSPAYSAHVGVEFRPTSNLSLSVGAGYSQSGRIDSDLGSPALLGASPFGFGRR
jgi:opacity protein-like surface antigen